MIKTWLIPIAASMIIMVSLLMVNLMVLSGSTLLAGFFKQRVKIVLADSLLNDAFNSVENIAEACMHSSKGNFSEFKKTLEEELERLTENLCDEEFFREYGILVRFSSSIEYYDEECSVEIISRIHVSDPEGFFSFERVYKTVKRQDSTVYNGLTG